MSTAFPETLTDLSETLPERVRGLGSSQIAEVADLAREDPAVIKLWIGEGDLPTPDFVTEAVVQALREGHTRYTYSLGLPRLRQALADYHRRHWGVEVAPSRFSVTSGGMNAVMQAFQAVLEPGDEVVHPSPAWPNLLEAARICGGVPVPVSYRRNAGGGFVLSLEDLFAAVTERTKVIVINSPSNPTGWVMPRADMERLLAFARERGIWILSDEVYNHFTYGNAIAPSFLEIARPDDRLLVTNTFSKNWAMTGWRAGWVVYPQGLDATFAKLNQYNTTSIPTFVQHAAIVALEQGDGFIRKMVGRCAESRQIFVDGLSRLPGVTLSVPEGAFYLFFSVEGEKSALDLAKRVLREAKVGVAPGTAFGPAGQGCLRLCFAISPELAREAMARLEGFFTRR
ncbi:pyridoxal phosphate-dependent aminotransferase [Roseomonas gilardii]|uniref:aspartate transaminase n=1 Tax=Roseomonas gilardii TaxID=257708 RepID=A0ABU3M9W2_9PROT|nr:pyridoxal phosphate-dependent aminotransferase [Roseomonas gilardii]MDT8329667.1 pyridoxal phosphate-dependent aminotransferase [Roseomonas gilardii]PZR10973.1 MAG: aminotransferase class I/II [Azospirillum brasilense]